MWDPAALADTGWEEGSVALSQRPYRLLSAFRTDHHSSTTEEKREAELVDSMFVSVDLLLSISIYLCCIASWCNVKCESVFEIDIAGYYQFNYLLPPFNSVSASAL